ncbi:MAG: 30S ribosomal protein S2 [Myxococcota bacterium]
MSDTPATPEAVAPAAAAATDAATNAATTATTEAAPAETMEGALASTTKEQEVSIRSLLEAGAHYGHQPGRWNPLMRSYIFGERNGTHIIDLDQSLPLFQEALSFLKETTAAGGSVLFVGTKRQAAGPLMIEAKRAGQHYVNNRWLGGMLTNWKTVKKSIDRYNNYLEILGNEEKREELSKKEQSSMQRQVEKYEKSLEGIRSMDKLPDAIFIIDTGKESIAVQEAKRLHIPIVGIVDTNNSPRHIDFVVPGNDDAIRSIDLYCTAVANACREGWEQHQAALVSQRKNTPKAEAQGDAASKTGRRVVEIKQQPRRGRGQGERTAGGGKSYSAGSDKPEEGAAPAKAGSTDKPADKPAGGES